MPLQYKNTFLEFVEAAPELKRSKTLPDLMFTFQQKPEFARVDSDAETECRSSESTVSDSLDSPLPASQRRPLNGPLWADMTDDEELDAPVAAPAAAAEPKPGQMSWADMTESDDEEVVTDAPAEEPTTHAEQETKKPDEAEIDGWTTVVKKGKKSRR